MQGHRTPATSPAARTTTPAGAGCGPHLTLRSLQFRMCFPRNSPRRPPSAPDELRPRDVRCGRFRVAVAGNPAVARGTRSPSDATARPQPIQVVCQIRYDRCNSHSVRCSSAMSHVEPNGSPARQQRSPAEFLGRPQTLLSRLQNFHVVRAPAASSVQIDRSAAAATTSPAAAQRRLHA
jgi:hypothetical protein